MFVENIFPGSAPSMKINIFSIELFLNYGQAIYAATYVAM